MKAQIKLRMGKAPIIVRQSSVFGQNTICIRTPNLPEVRVLTCADENMFHSFVCTLLPNEMYYNRRLS